MYKVSVPVMLTERFDREGTLALLRRFGAERVMVALDGMSSSKYEISDAQATRLGETLKFFERSGLETCVWINTLGHGNVMESDSYAVAVAPDGGPGGGYCPLDPAFRDDVCGDVKKIARAGAQELLLDDDFRLAFKRGGVGCFCDRHLDAFAEKFGAHLSREELVAKACTGAPSEERSAWLDTLGESLLDFARAIRAAADEVNPSMRVGLCASPSTWDVDGVDSLSLARALAGGTKPLLRYIGAPYWGARGAWNQSVADTISLTALESRWVADMERDIPENSESRAETLGEGDAYPRPRFMTPASYLEGFDAGCRACGSTDGILKYGADYTSSPRYETGYAAAHERDSALFAEIERRFAGKTGCGIDVYEPMRKLKAMYLPEKFDANAVSNSFFPQSIRFLSDNSLPFGCGGATVVFGGAAESVRPDASGLILDYAAAVILTRRGVDVGLRCDKTGAAERIYPSAELFEDENELVALTGGAKWYRMAPDESARVLSTLDCGGAASYLYENASGARFLVFAFASDCSDADGAAYRSYCRARQTVKCAEWLAGEPLEAYFETEAPDAYVYCAVGPDSLAILVWNAFPDAIERPVVVLSREYTRAESPCGASLEGKKLALPRIEPYGFAVAELFV